MSMRSPLFVPSSLLERGTFIVINPMSGDLYAFKARRNRFVSSPPLKPPNPPRRRARGGREQLPETVLAQCLPHARAAPRLPICLAIRP